MMVNTRVPIKILLVHENPDDIRLITDMLELSNTAVSLKSRHNLVATLQLLQNETFDVVLLDHGQAHNSIQEILQVAPNMAVVILGEQQDENKIQKAVLHGAQDYLLKSDFSPQMLIRVIRYAISCKNSDQQLRKLSSVIEQSPITVVFTDPSGDIEYVNPKFTDITGYSTEEVLGENPRILKSGHTTSGEYEHLWETISAGGEWHGEFLNRKKDGSHYWERATISGIKNTAGQITHYVGLKTDITEEKNALAALAESEERYRNIFDHAGDAIFVYDLDGRILDASQTACKLLAYSHQELITLHISDIEPTQNTKKLLEEFILKGYPGVATIETEFVSKTNMAIPVESNFQLIKIGGEPAILNIARNIAKRKTIEAAEKKSRKLAMALADIAAKVNSSLELDKVLIHILTNVGKVVPHEEANIMFVDGKNARIVKTRNTVTAQLKHPTYQPFEIEHIPTLSRMYGSQEALIIPDVDKFAGWADISRSNWIQSYAGAPICTNGEVFGFINLNSSKKGSFSASDAHYLQAFANHAAIAIKNAKHYNELESYAANLEAKIEEHTYELKRAKERVETILNTSPTPTLLIGAKGTMETANPAFMNMFGLNEGEIFGRSPLLTLPLQSIDSLENSLGDTIKNGISTHFSAVANRKDGSQFDVEISLSPSKNGEVSGIVCSIHDITAHKELERIKDAFVSNVSHELRTPITNIMLNHQLMERKPECREKYFLRIQRETERLSQLINDLLNLSRMDKKENSIEFVPFEMNTLVAQLVADREALAEEKGIDLQLHQADDLPQPKGDPGLIQLATSIFLTNAINYTQSGGKVSLRTHFLQFDDSYWCGVSIQDNGPGIEQSDLVNLYQRFYRGKAGRESGVPGTGLGLSIAKKIAEYHNGRIEIKSEGIPGKGSTFILWLPISKY